MAKGEKIRLIIWSSIHFALIAVVLKTYLERQSAKLLIREIFIHLPCDYLSLKKALKTEWWVTYFKSGHWLLAWGYRQILEEAVFILIVNDWINFVVFFWKYGI